MWIMKMVDGEMMIRMIGAEASHGKDSNPYSITGLDMVQ
jgi:hypothetical protein